MVVQMPNTSLPAGQRVYDLLHSGWATVVSGGRSIVQVEHDENYGLLLVDVRSLATPKQYRELKASGALDR